MSPDQIAAVVMMSLLLVMVICGVHLAFALFFLAIIFGLIFQGPMIFSLAMLKIFGTMQSEILIAVPLFVFMGTILEKSEIAEGVYQSLYELFGPVRGGLAFATVITCTIFASCTGVIAATVTTMTLLAVPSMIKRKYDKGLATGVVCAGGSLGILIPPSVMLVMYGPMANLSVAQLFAAALFPGLVLSVLYLAYIGMGSWLKPKMAPAIGEDERSAKGARLWMRALKQMVPSVVLILAVLGSIIAGVASPTEASGVGAFAALIIAALYRKLNYANLREAAYTTLIVTAMVFFIIIGAAVFNSVFLFLGGGALIKAILDGPAFGQVVRAFRDDVRAFHPGFFHFLAGAALRGGPHLSARGRQPGLSSPLVRPAHLPEFANVLFNAALCLCHFFRQGRRAAGGKDLGHLPRGHSLCDPPGFGRAFVHRLSRNHPLAAPGDPGSGMTTNPAV